MIINPQNKHKTRNTANVEKIQCLSWLLLCTRKEIIFVSKDPFRTACSLPYSLQSPFPLNFSFLNYLFIAVTMSNPSTPQRSADTKPQKAIVASSNKIYCARLPTASADWILFYYIELSIFMYNLKSYSMLSPFWLLWIFFLILGNSVSCSPRP